MNSVSNILPRLDDVFSLNKKNIEEFRETGHTLTHGLLSPAEINAYSKVISAAAKKYNTEKRKMEDRDTYGKAFL